MRPRRAVVVMVPPAAAVMAPPRAHVGTAPGRCVVVPRLALLGRCAEVAARPDDPRQQEEARDGSDDDASDGAAAECC